MTAIVDVHAHYYPPSYLDAVRKLVDLPGQVGDAARFTTAHPFIHRIPHFTGAFDERIALMNQAEIAVQVLSFSAPNIWHPDPQIRSDLVRIFNDGCAEITQRYPERIQFFANLPLPFVHESIKEAERALDNLGALGLGLCTHFSNFALTDERFYPLYQYIDERKSVIFLHPDPEPVPGFLEDSAMVWALGAPFEDTAALYRLLNSGLLERFPNISWIVPHCGGTLPALSGRLDEIWAMNPDPHRALSASPSNYLRSHALYVDCATPQTSLIAMAHDLFGEEHLLFGSDFPYIRSSLRDLRAAIEPIERLPLSFQGRQNLLSTNATALLALKGSDAL